MPITRLAEETTDTSRKVFGRAADIALLIERTQFPGITAVVGIPQIGKSTLLAEVEDRLATSGWPGQTRNGNGLSLQGLPPLVGLVKSSPEYANTLRRAVENLYTRWIKEASYPEQARVVFENERKNWIVRTGQTVGAIFETLGKAHGSPGAAIATTVRGVFDALAQANQNLTNPGSQLPRLEVEDSRELLRLACEVSKRPAVLLFDAWEASPDHIKEVGMLRAFVDEIDDWPPCHIVLGLTPGDHAKGLRRLGRHPSGVVLVHDLQPMDTADTAARDPLLAYVRSEVPAARECTNDDLLGLISGHPGVLAYWTSKHGRECFHTRADLVQAAQDACNYSYTEFEDLLPKLTADERTVAMRLVLLPAFSNASDWKALQPIVLEGSGATVLDDLLEKGVLEFDSPPTYGHAKRAEAAQAYFTSRRRQGMRETAELLIRALASEVRDLTPRVLPYILGLVAARRIASELSPLAQALCEAAFTLLDDTGVDAGKFIGITAASAAPVSHLLAMGLLNTLNAARQEEKLERRDSLLEELRELARVYPADTAVRENLAMGLFNTLNAAEQEEKLERRDSLLEELRELARVYPADAAVREQLAGGLFNTLNAARQEERLEWRDRLLEELRELARAYPADGAVREQLAMGLFNTLTYARQEEKLEWRDSLLEELRELARVYPADTAVRENLAMGLFNTLNAAEQEEKLERRDSLLEELRELARVYPTDAAVREGLAKGLLNTLDAAKQEERLEWRDRLLEELRELARVYPADATVRELLAKGLFNTLTYAKQEEKLEWRDSLLEELRELARVYPADAAVRENLAAGLFNTLIDAKQEEKLERRDSLLEELRELARVYPADTAVREQLAAGLFNTLNDARQEEKLERRDSLLEELRGLVRDNPDDPFLRDEVAPRIRDQGA